MNRLGAAFSVFLLLVVADFAIARADPPKDQMDAQANLTAQEWLEAAANATNAGDCQKGNELVQQLLAMPEFLQLPEFEQYRGVLVAAVCAMELGHVLEAHDYLLAVTSFEFAESEDWRRRAYTAIQVEDWEDSLLSLTSIVRRWPEGLAGNAYDDWAVTHALQMSGRDATLGAARLEFMNVLFAAGYTQEGGAQPDEIWLELAAEALRRGDMPRARLVAKRIAGSPALVELNSDRRFDALLEAEPTLRDVRGAALREKLRLRAESAKYPRSLGVLMRYEYALYTLGEFKEMLELSERALGAVREATPSTPAFDDVETHLSWLHAQKSLALRALGREQDAIQVLRDWQHDPRNTGDTASQAINLADMLNRAGQPREALDVVGDIDWTRGLSPYGRMQLQSVRHQAFLRLDQRNEAETVLAWIREHQQESPATARAALMMVGDLDAAAALLIASLDNPDARAATLASLQQYQRLPRNSDDFYRRTAQNYRRLLERPDVKAAIGKYGRVGSFPVYRMQ